MRNIVLGLGISIDGYIARRDGSVDFLFMPRDYSMAPFMASVDTVMMGRKTLDAALKMGDSFGGSAGKTYVFSRTLPPGDRDGVVFVDRPPKELAVELRAQRGKNIWLMGGGELAREFLKEDLVDEMELGIVPVLLGEGIPLFPGGFPQRDFALVENKSYSKGLATLKYRRLRPRGKS